MSAQITAAEESNRSYAHLRVGFGEGNGTPLQYSCLENPMDRGAWWATVHGVTKSRTELKRLIMHVSILFQILFPSRLSQSVG